MRPSEKGVEQHFKRQFEGYTEAKKGLYDEPWG